MIKNILKITAAVSLIPAALFAQKQSGWNSLPEDTIAAVNINFSKEITDKIQNNTKLGKKILSKDRLSRLKQIITNHASVNPEMAAGMAEMKAAGFSLDDIFDLFNNNMGIGVIAGEAGNHRYFTALLWADFSDELINKIYKIVDEKAGEAKKRNDIELDGEKVIHLFAGKDTSNVMITRLGQRLIVAISDFDKSTEYGGFSESDLEALERSFEKKSGKNALKIKPFQDEFVEGAEKEPVDSARAAAGVALGEILKGTTARFLMAQKGDGGEFTSRLLSKPGVAKARPSGDMMIEAYLDISKVIEFAGGINPEMKMIGIDNIEALALWSAMDGNQAKTSFFVSAPAPRKGLLSLMDQPLTAALPPEWVPENVMSYSHVSFDFNTLYNVIKDIASSQLGPGAVDAQEEQANQTLRAFLQTDIQSIVKSFGKKIYLLNFGLEMQQISGANANSAIAVSPVDKSAFIFEFTNDEIMKKVFGLMEPFVAQQGLVRTKEQGFDGYRADTPFFKGSLFYGQKKLVLSIGEGTTETILSSLANPPKGADALLNSKKFIDFVKKENPTQSMIFSYGDASEMIPMIYSAFSEMFTKEDIISEMVDDREKAFVKDLMELIPTESEIDGIFGTSHSIGLPVQSGFIFKSSLELP